MTTSANRRGPVFSARAVDLTVSDDTLVVRLEDGRFVGIPIVWFPRLAAASEEKRNNWRLIGRGVGIHWPDLDEDVSVHNLLAVEGELLLVRRHAVDASAYSASDC